MENPFEDLFGIKHTWSQDKLAFLRGAMEQIGKALHRGMNDVAPAIDQQLGAREAASVDVLALQMIVDPVKRRFGHANGFGRGRRRG